MKKVNDCKRKKLLELVESADKGDLIDLKEVVQVDTSNLDILRASTIKAWVEWMYAYEKMYIN